MIDKTGDIHEVSHAVGRLEGMYQTMMEELRAASSGRRSLYEKIEDVREELGMQIAGTNLRVDRALDAQKEMAATLTAIEPAMKAFSDEKLRSEGAKRLGLRLWTSLIAGAGAFGWAAHELFNWWKVH